MLCETGEGGVDGAVSSRFSLASAKSTTHDPDRHDQPKRCVEAAGRTVPGLTRSDGSLERCVPNEASDLVVTTLCHIGRNGAGERGVGLAARGESMRLNIAYFARLERDRPYDAP